MSQFYYSFPYENATPALTFLTQLTILIKWWTPAPLAAYAQPG